MTEPLEVTECRVVSSKDGERIKISFFDDFGNRSEVALHQGYIPQFVAMVLSGSDTKSHQPIDRNQIIPGSTFSSFGFRISHVSDGGIILHIFLKVNNQDVSTLDLDFSAKDLETLFSMITQKGNDKKSH